MSPKLARILVRLYPRAWRERYGTEFEALLEDNGSGLPSAMNVVRAAISERILAIGGGRVMSDEKTFRGVLLHPSAIIPMAMSTAALAILIGHFALYGVAREADEGPAAHMWQILMAGQIPVLLFFAIKWLPRAFKPALGVLAVQAGAVLAAMAPVFYFNL
jgi:hypothetical protein